MNPDNIHQLLIISSEKENALALRRQLEDKGKLSWPLLVCEFCENLDVSADVKLILLNDQQDNNYYDQARKLQSMENTRHLPVVILTEHIERVDIDKVLSFGVLDVIELSSVFTLIQHRLRNYLKMVDSKNKQLVLQTDKIKNLCQLIRYTCHELASPIGNAATTISYLQEISSDIVKKMHDKTLAAADLNHYLKQQETAYGMCERNISNASAGLKSFWSVSTAQCYDELAKVNLSRFVEDIVRTLHSRLKKLPFKIDIAIPEIIEITTYKGSFAQLIIGLLEYSIMLCLAGKDSGHILITIVPGETGVVLTFNNDGDTNFSRDMDLKGMIGNDAKDHNIATSASFLDLEEMVCDKLKGSLTLQQDELDDPNKSQGQSKGETCPLGNLCQIILPKEIFV